VIKPKNEALVTSVTSIEKLLLQNVKRSIIQEELRTTFHMSYQHTSLPILIHSFPKLRPTRWTILERILLINY
jgi:hypothetical protein